MAELTLLEACCAVLPNRILTFHFRSDLTLTAVQAGVRHVICHRHGTCSLWVPRPGPKLTDWTRDTPPCPWLGFSGLWTRLYISCRSAPQWWVSTYPAVSSFCWVLLHEAGQGHSLHTIHHTKYSQHTAALKLLGWIWWQQCLSSRFLQEIPYL